jgi:nitrogen-specific signal transduction histidine kinase
MAFRQQRQQKQLMEQAERAAAASMANDLAHQINNPLQSLTNILYLASEDTTGRPQSLSEILHPKICNG